jgi:hypothetical protein
MLTLFLAGSNNHYGNPESRYSNLRSKIDVLTEFSNVIILSNEKAQSVVFEDDNLINVRYIPSGTSGALATAAFGLSAINEGQPFIIVPSNAFILESGIKKFQENMLENKVAVGAIVFESKDPIFSYARLDKSGGIAEIIEKKVSGSCALAGVYYFANSNLFAGCIEWAMVNNVSTAGKFYISPALNYFLANSIPIALYEISSENYSRDSFTDKTD